MAFVVQPGERNAADQRMLEYALQADHGVAVTRVTLKDLAERCEVKEDGTLLLPGGAQASVLYFRAGYTPTDYPSAVEWEGRAKAELSRAIKVRTPHASPPAPSPLLTRPLPGPCSAPPSTTTWWAPSGSSRRSPSPARWSGSPRRPRRRRCCDPCSPISGRWTVRAGKRCEGSAHCSPGPGAGPLTPSPTTLTIPSFAAQAEQAVAEAKADPSRFVLKPQREGGGNNLYGDEVAEGLTSMGAHELGAYILMQRIFPARRPAVLVKEGRAVEGEAISELGIYGATLADGERFLYRGAGGTLMRTKVLGCMTPCHGLHTPLCGSVALTPFQTLPHCTVRRHGRGRRRDRVRLPGHTLPRRR